MNSAQPLVSIVVPVYNAQEYLGYCINSLTSQTYPNLQIILIDDGSTDDSLQICRNYQALDRRINVIEQWRKPCT
jgi:glycosyltransferase involved in cell wall biosynthesis